MKTVVLVVDDDRDIRTSLVFLLEDEGYAVLEAADGVQALEMLRRQQRHLVVALDWMMPHLDGPHVLAAVEADVTLRRRHQFFFMTACNDQFQGAFAAYVSEHAIPVIPKPFDLTRLLATVRQLAHRLERERSVIEGA
jgi:CheY-like chemotaxis protein